MSGPSVTVLMAAHNAAPFLRPAVDSVLNQSFSDFRLLVVNDASTDDTREILRSYRDNRIQLLNLPKNGGQTHALNVGLERISTPWIARMDGDDICAPDRLEEQMKAVRTDPRLGCVGTFAWCFTQDPQHQEGVIEKPLEDAAIRSELLRGTPIIHGTLLIHREALLAVGGYDERYRYSADRALFNRLFHLPGFLGRNLPVPLLGVRRHPAQGSFCRRAADENIEIFSEMLQEKGRPWAERRVLQESLSFSYRFRARCSRSEGKFTKIPGDLLHALRVRSASWMEDLRKGSRHVPVDG
ncbi:MAG: glycosyltransferase family 2 protein [Candidatus Omnitrophica bacterium]|nr:glycosyltransferase family 2 protein [Candidatus Omnitrophota bacterium]